MDTPSTPNAVFFNALKNCAERGDSAWHTPGHNGGAFFLRSKTGREFRNFVGRNMCRADMSVSVEELGSLLGHEGKIGEAERNAAKTFGADETYFVLGGTSAANQMIIEACAAENDVAAIDRNCHKSVYHALISTGAEPAYIRPVRNKMGMSGPIPWRATSEENMRGLLAETPGTKGRTPKILTLTNSNYDGVCAEISHFLKNPPAR
ncbi:MAG: hypothetical protein J6J65_03440, partial [Opitutales bacterium]|nr:hypothetical protein [Opitutales bacterium]